MGSVPDVVVAGHICLDIIPDLASMSLGGAEELYQPGTLANIGPATICTGGAVSNTGLAMTRLGMRTSLMAKIGRDPFGETVRSILRAQDGSDEGLIVEDDAITSYTVVLNPSGFDRMFLHCPGANDHFVADDLDYDLIGKARLFHFGYPTLMARMFAEGGAELEAMYARVKQQGVATSMDMTTPDPASPSGRADWRWILSRVLPHVDFVLPSVEEIAYMLDRSMFERYRSRTKGDLVDCFTAEDLHQLSSELLAMGARIVMIKCGHRGLYARTADAEALSTVPLALPGTWAARELWHPTFVVDTVVGATGAGDCAIAGLLCSALRGREFPAALANASAAGACNVTAADALSGLLPWDRMEEKIAAGWPTTPMGPPGPNWSADGRVWTHE